MITKPELLHGRETKYAADFTSAISSNLDATLHRVNLVRSAFGRPMTVNSGWRPPSINGSTPGAAPHSNHMRGLAVDFRDHDGILRSWCLANLAVLQRIGIWMEDFQWTPTWVHMQIVAPHSGGRIFQPNATRPHAQNWDRQYDKKKFDGPLNSYHGH
jgi:hypothetical protein